MDEYLLLTVNPYPPGGTPAQPAPDPEPAPAKPAPPSFRYRQRYGVVYCEDCGYAVPFCKGHGRPVEGARDGAESDLNRRVRECKGR